MNQTEKVLKFIHSSEKLKTVKRAISVSDNSHKESPAEHSWRTALMALVLKEEFNINIDLEKTLRLILVHDLPEIVTDDTWRLIENKAVEKRLKNKEIKAIDEIYSPLPKNSKSKLKKLALEFANQTSREARFAKALDKIEVIIQRIDLKPKNWERKDIYEVLLHWADNSSAKVPETKKLWELVQRELKSAVEKETG